jgi:hypothetical protein
MLTFGKHRGKTFEYVFENDFNYCNWCLKQTPHNQNMKDFAAFVKQNIENKPLKIPNGIINVSELYGYYCNASGFVDLLQGLNIQTIELDSNLLSETTLPRNINGTFVDYLIRYQVCELLHREFHDERFERYVNGYKGEHISSYGITLRFPTVNHVPQKYKHYIRERDSIREIDDSFYVEIKEIMRESYGKMKFFTATPNDVLNVSLSHMLFFGEGTAYNYFNHFQDNEIFVTCEDLKGWVSRKLANNEGGDVLCNPTLGVPELKLKGDADLIIGEELIDIKCHSFDTGTNINDFTQLFIYVCLYFVRTGNRCNRITIFNPMLRYEKSIDLSRWNNFEPMIDLLRRRVQSEAT